MELLDCESASVDINCTDNQGRTSLIIATGSGYEYLLRPLVVRGADIQQKDNNGFDALFTACSRGHFVCAAILLGLGADIDAVEHRNATALHAAARMGHIDIVRFLLRMGARADIRSTEAFNGMEVVGTAAEIAGAIRFQNREGLAESIEELIRTWNPRTRGPSPWEVRFNEMLATRDDNSSMRSPSFLRTSSASPESSLPERRRSSRPPP